ncbi:MAG: ABC-F type ribosomal protection protein [Bacteroides sp.]|nr:ABC-F type ribosomal protection protein [Bacteroides sp.]MCM1548663.1 ABC-F type ribosomal protection protein [Clostridium sp.]
MILACQNISKSFGIQDVLKDIQFHIEEKEKAAIVGINGAGKTTLLKIIMGEEIPDSGQVILGKDKTIGYLAQQQEASYENTIYEEMLSVKQHIIELDRQIRQTELAMKHAEGGELDRLLNTYTRLTHAFESANGYAYKSEITGVLKGLGFTEADYNTRIATLSGGQKTRIALGRLLLSQPDIILLDEPTNHLDMDSIAWLEGYLTNYDGAVLIVSHDRYFLDRIVTKIVELENGTSRVYNGNYSWYAEKREEIRASEWKAYSNQQAEIQHQEEVIAKLRSFNREKSIKRAESREKLLNRMDILEKPNEVRDAMRIRLEPEVESGTDVLQMEHLSKSFGSNCLFQDIAMDIKRGERVALIGNNGTGKTTILKIINQYVPKDAGRILLGSRVKIGYYDQEHQVLSPEKTIFQEISDAYPALTNTRIRTILAAFLFTGDDVFKQIRDLSGGERGRVSLAKLMLSSANLLILDEPTNHLDITSKEILESALCSYTGTILYVSHDRYFINKTATRILNLTGGHLNEYKGNYDYYLEKKDLVEGLYQQTEGHPAVPSDSSTASSAECSKADWQSKKEEQARIRKKANHLKKLEEQIEALESRTVELDKELCKPEIATNADRCMALAAEKEEIQQQLNILYEQWEHLAE